MLVGNTQGPSGLTPLTEQWDGKHWKVVPNAAEGEFASGISCVGSSFCAVVGSSEVGSGLLTTFGEVWDGTSWTSTPTPNPGIRGAGLDGVSCVAPTSCVAVGGASGNGSSAQYPSLALDWNGSTWSQFASQNGPDPGGYNVLAGVSCHATLSSCTAVGWYTPPGGTDQTLIESWTSTGWTIVPSPEAPGGSNDLESVSCPLASFCVATGITASEKGRSSKNGTARPGACRREPTFPDRVKISSSACRAPTRSASLRARTGRIRERLHTTHS